jgi:DNA-binding LytR/AlgR family response regulator
MTPRRPTALVAEDEEVLRKELVERLHQLWPELHVIAEAADGIEALQLFDTAPPDVVFLDIRMPGLSGLDVAREINGRSHVVFLTAFDVHAVEAFEQEAVDYVLKPYDKARLLRALRRVQRRLATPPERMGDWLGELAESRAGRNYLQWINASHGSEVRLITVDEVCYFQADTKYVRVVTAEGEALIRRSLRELAEQLDPARFWTIHRSTIVNADAIASVSRDFAGNLQVRLKRRPERLPVSDAHKRLFKQM